MSLQIAILRNLASRQRCKTTVWMIDADKLKEYELQPRRHRADRDRARQARHRGLHQQARRRRSPHAHLGGAGARLSTGQGRADRGNKVEFTMTIESVDR